LEIKKGQSKKRKPKLIPDGKKGEGRGIGQKKPDACVRDKEMLNRPKQEAESRRADQKKKKWQSRSKLKEAKAARKL